MRALFHKIMKRKRCSAAGGRRLAAPGSGSGFGVKGFAGRHERAGRSSDPVPLLQLTCVSYAPDSGMKPAIQNIWVLARRYFQTQTAPDIQNLTVFLKALFQNSAEKSLAARGAIVANCGAATPRRVVMRHGGGTECDLGVLSAKRKRERVLTRPIARHLEGAEVMFRRTEPLGGGAARILVAFRPRGTRAAKRLGQK